MDAGRSFRFELSFNGITNVCSNTTEIWQPVFIFRDPLTIVTNFEIKFTFLFSTDNDDLSCTSVNAVFHKFCHRLQRVGLRFGNDADGIPMISNAQLAGADVFSFYAPISPLLTTFGQWFGLS